MRRPLPPAKFSITIQITTTTLPKHGQRPGSPASVVIKPMKLRRTTRFALAAMLVITLTDLTAHAGQSHSAPATSAQDLNLSDAQVFKIQALLLSQTAKMRSLTQSVQAAQDALNSAIAKGDPALTAMQYSRLMLRKKR
jgi:hypothetical protein